jgi:hypothetical protein
MNSLSQFSDLYITFLYNGHAYTLVPPPASLTGPVVMKPLGAGESPSRVFIVGVPPPPQTPNIHVSMMGAYTEYNIKFPTSEPAVAYITQYSTDDPLQWQPPEGPDSQFNTPMTYKDPTLSFSSYVSKYSTLAFFPLVPVSELADGDYLLGNPADGGLGALLVHLAAAPTATRPTVQSTSRGICKTSGVYQWC